MNKIFNFFKNLFKINVIEKSSHYDQYLIKNPEGKEKLANQIILFIKKIHGNKKIEINNSIYESYRKEFIKDFTDTKKMYPKYTTYIKMKNKKNNIIFF